MISYHITWVSIIRDLLLHSGDNFLLLHHLGLPLLQHLLPGHQEGANAGRDDGEPTDIDESDVRSSDTSGHPDPGTILKGEDDEPEKYETDQFSAVCCVSKVSPDWLETLQHYQLTCRTGLVYRCKAVQYTVQGIVIMKTGKNIKVNNFINKHSWSITCVQNAKM